MKQKKSDYASAIRALDFSTTKYPPACERFIGVLGLTIVFAAFMGKIPSKSNKNGKYLETREEYQIGKVTLKLGFFFKKK